MNINSHKKGHIIITCSFFFSLLLYLSFMDTVRYLYVLKFMLYKGISHFLLALTVTEFCLVTAKRPCNLINSRCWEKKKVVWWEYTRCVLVFFVFWQFCNCWSLYICQMDITGHFNLSSIWIQFESFFFCTSHLGKSG